MPQEFPSQHPGFPFRIGFEGEIFGRDQHLDILARGRMEIGPALQHTHGANIRVDHASLAVSCQSVGLQHESPHKGRRRMVQKNGRFPALVQHPALHHGHPIADGHGLLRIVGDEQSGGPTTAQHLR